MDDPNTRAGKFPPQRPGDHALERMREITRETVNAINAMTQRNQPPYRSLDILDRMEKLESRITEIERRLNPPPAA